MICPSLIATGGTESIHKFASTLNKCEGMDVKILYRGQQLDNPCPEPYKKYGVSYITEFPKGFKGTVIMPELWGDELLDPQYKECIKVINWAGVGAYEWNNPKRLWYRFLQDESIIHLVQSVYAEWYLKRLNIHPKQIMPLSDVLNDIYFEEYTQKERSNEVLYNPAKFTDFQLKVLEQGQAEGIVFKPLQGYTTEQMADVMRHSKLYVELGVFPGRERVPREAAMCGCCVIATNEGAGAFYEDVVVQSKYKFNMTQVNEVVQKIKYVLTHYEECYPDFEEYRQSLKQDKENLPAQCKALAERLVKESK